MTETCWRLQTEADNIAKELLRQVEQADDDHRELLKGESDAPSGSSFKTIDSARVVFTFFQLSDSTAEIGTLRRDTVMTSTTDQTTLEKASVRHGSALRVGVDIEKLDSICRGRGITATDFEMIHSESKSKADSASATLFPTPLADIFYALDPVSGDVLHMTVNITLSQLMRKSFVFMILSFFIFALIVASVTFQIRTILRQNAIENARRDFVTTLTHELRRPIQTLKMCVSFLRDPSLRSDDDMTQQVLTDSSAELDGMTAYLAQTREANRSGFGEYTPCVAETDIRQLLLDKMRRAAISNDKEVTFTTDIPEQPIMMNVDALHIGNVFGNIIENAIKYSPAHVGISLGIKADAERCIITISNDGFPIHKKDLPHIFESFYRSDEFSGRDIPGVGLGLAYAQRVVGAHRGEITATSDGRRGASFTISLPH